MRPAPRACALLLAAALTGACTTLVDRRVETAIERELPRLIGPAARYEVSVAGADPDAGYLQRLRIAGQRVLRERAPALDRLDLDLHEVRVDRERKQVTSLEHATARVRVLPQDVAAHLQRQGWFDDVSVAFTAPNGVVIDGRPTLGGIRLPAAATVEARGRLVARRSQLRIELDDLRAAGFSVPGLLRGAIQLAINPVLDAGAFPVPARFETVSHDGEALVVTASASQAPDAY